MIEIIPAIDIIEGQCVRLQQGNYYKKTIYEKDPVKIAKRFEKYGIKRVHIVDLEGAKAKRVINLDTLERITAVTNLSIDFGGGIKTEDDFDAVLEAGAKMATIGSVAISNKPLLVSWIKKYGSDKIILGADVKNRKIAIGGWLETTQIDLFDLLKDYSKLGVKNVLCTDISKDGMLQGTALELYREMRKEFPNLYLIASGGITNLTEIDQLNDMGIDAVIIGKAIYENLITLEDLQPYLKS